MNKGKSKFRSKRDNETPEKMSDDSRSNNDTDSNNKVSDSFEELKITEETLQKFYQNSNYDDEYNISKSVFAVRYELPPDKQKPLTKKICVLKRAPAHVDAVPSSTLLEQMSLRIDEYQRPVQHSILGSLEDFFKMSINKQKLTLEEIPSEFHHLLGESPKRQSVTSLLPAQRDITKKEDLRSSRKIDTSRIAMDSDTKALRLWEQRMMERRNVQSHISNKIQRMPESLIFNSGEDFRKKLESNYLISKSIPFYGAGFGYRSGSEFWKQSETVGADNVQQLHMSNTQAEKGYPPSILHVGVAKSIKLEKGVPETGPGTKMKHKDYETRRYEQLKQVIFELDPHQPEIDDLIIKGTQVKNMEVTTEPVSEFNDLSEIINEDLKNDSFVSNGLSGDDTDNSTVFPVSRGPCLVINSLKLNNYQNFMDQPPLEIRILFNDYTGNKCLQKIHFRNNGTSIIRFWWKKLESYDPFELENKDIRRFYFNTQDGILLPNEELHFPVIFKSEKSGIYSERWRVETLPTVAQGQDIVISLSGVALQRDTCGITRKKIENYMNYQVADDIVRGVLDDILQSMYYQMQFKSTEDEQVDSEAEMFMLCNERIIYDIDSVSSLKKLHRELSVKEENMNEEWDLSCPQLRKDIYGCESIKSVKKEEACAKFYKHIDKMMFSSPQSVIGQKDLLYRIGYRTLIEFGSNMFTTLTELRRGHDIPEMELRMMTEKKGSNLSRQRTSNSQLSKTSVKKQNDSRASISTVKIKSKEPSILFRESTDVLLTEMDETDRLASRSASDIDDLQTDNEPSQGHSTNPNVRKYHTKSYQLVYALLDGAIDNIINFWDDLTKK